MSQVRYDVFLSYASEDAEVADEITRALVGRGIRVWRDNMMLRVGDSLRRSIDRALNNAQYGVVLLSKNFLSKEWPQRELDGLVTREISEGRTVVLPVWHEISALDIRSYSAPLADKVALHTSNGIEAIVEGIASLLGSDIEARRLAESVSDRGFYFRKMALSAEVTSRGAEWSVIWRASIVATRDGLAGFQTSYRIDDIRPESLSDTVEEEDVEIETLDTPHPRAIARFFRFSRELNRGEERQVTYVRQFIKMKAQERDMFVRKGAIRCDELNMEVKFDVLPAELLYRVTDRAELVTYREERFILGVGSRFFRHETTTDPALAYGFYWVYPESESSKVEAHDQIT